MATTRIAILGSTGSIGTSALSVVDTHADRLQVVGLAAGNNVAASSPSRWRRYAPRAVATRLATQGVRELAGADDGPVARRAAPRG